MPLHAESSHTHSLAKWMWPPGSTCMSKSVCKDPGVNQTLGAYASVLGTLRAFQHSPSALEGSCEYVGSTWCTFPCFPQTVTIEDRVTCCGAHAYDLDLACTCVHVVLRCKHMASSVACDCYQAVDEPGWSHVEPHRRVTRSQHAALQPPL